MKKVKLKSADELKNLVKDGTIKMLHCSDSGEWVTYGVTEGAATHIFNVWFEDYGQEYEVTKLDNNISESLLEKLKILFET